VGDGNEAMDQDRHELEDTDNGEAVETERVAGKSGHSPEHDASAECDPHEPPEGVSPAETDPVALESPPFSPLSAEASAGIDDTDMQETPTASMGLPGQISGVPTAAASWEEPEVKTGEVHVMTG